MPKKIRSSTPDTRTIDLEDQYAIDFWTNELKVTKIKLKTAVSVVGDSVIDVKRELKKTSK